MRTTMMQVEIYHGHAGLFHQMANHIELSMMPQHRRENGGPDPITTNDVTLATTLFNSIFGYPAGKEAVLALGRTDPWGGAISKRTRTLHDDGRMF